VTQTVNALCEEIASPDINWHRNDYNNSIASCLSFDKLRMTPLHKQDACA